MKIKLILLSLIVSAFSLGAAMPPPVLRNYYTTNANPILNGTSIVTPQQYGAVGNGVTDDSSAFTLMVAAVNAGDKNIYIPHGTYRIGVPLTITRETLLIYGDGTNSMIHQTNLSANIIKIGVNCRNINISDLTLWGAGTNSTGNGVYAGDTIGCCGEELILERLHIRQNGVGINLSNMTCVSIRDSIISANETAGISASTVGAITVENCSIGYCQSAALDPDNHYGWTTPTVRSQSIAIKMLWPGSGGPAHLSIRGCEIGNCGAALWADRGYIGMYDCNIETLFCSGLPPNAIILTNVFGATFANVTGGAGAGRDDLIAFGIYDSRVENITILNFIMPSWTNNPVDIRGLSSGYGRFPRINGSGMTSKLMNYRDTYAGGVVATAYVPTILNAGETNSLRDTTYVTKDFARPDGSGNTTRLYLTTGQGDVRGIHIEGFNGADISATGSFDTTRTNNIRFEHDAANLFDTNNVTGEIQFFTRGPAVSAWRWMASGTNSTTFQGNIRGSGSGVTNLNPGAANFIPNSFSGWIISLSTNGGINSTMITNGIVWTNIFTP